MMLREFLITLLLIIVLIYTAPALQAVFAGSHTLEAGDVNQLACLKCHSYIAKEMNFTDLSRDTLNAHIRAANNTNYTTFIKYGYHYNASEGRIYTTQNTSLWDLGSTASSNTYIYYTSVGWIDNRSGVWKYATVSLDKNGIPGIQIEESCLLCHNADTVHVTTHTDTTVVGCTMIKCHGNSSGTGYGNEFYPATQVGNSLSNNNAHSDWFKEMGNHSSSYNYRVFGSNITADYFTCLGCHTYVQVNANITWPAPYMHNNYSAPKKRYI